MKLPVESKKGQSYNMTNTLKLESIRRHYRAFPPRPMLVDYFDSKTKDLYFITDGEYIKIGVAINVKNRLDNMQVGNVRKLTLLAVCEYGEELEAIYHQKFKEEHIRGEWFRLSDKIWEEIEFINNKHEELYKIFSDDEETIKQYFTS